MRLIDADKLIEKLRDFKEWENDDGRPIHTMSETQRIDRCINFAQTEPTAFDADKVVSELEKNASRYTKKYVTPYGNNGYRDTKAISIHKAIEIVKQEAEKFGTDINVVSNGWIPCSERLPEIDGNTSDTVLVCGSNGFLYMAFWCDDLQWRFCECGMAKEPVLWTEITAWQPLPEPFKERD